MANFTPVSRYLNARAVDHDGEFVGWVRELLIDARDGRVEYVRIELVRPEVDIPTEIVVPWSAVERDKPGAPMLRIAARRSTLELLAEV